MLRWRSCLVDRGQLCTTAQLLILLLPKQQSCVLPQGGGMIKVMEQSVYLGLMMWVCVYREGSPLSVINHTFRKKIILHLIILPPDCSLSFLVFNVKPHSKSFEVRNIQPFFFFFAERITARK